MRAALRLVNKGLVPSRLRPSTRTCAYIRDHDADEAPPHALRRRDRLLLPGKNRRLVRHTLRNASLARELGALLELPGGARLFRFERDGEPANLTGPLLNEYIGDRLGDGFTAKDFRTWGGHPRRRRGACPIGLPTDEADAKRALASAMRKVGAELGNTPAVARASYVSPAVVEHYLAGRTIDDFGRRRAGQALGADEHARSCGCFGRDAEGGEGCGALDPPRSAVSASWRAPITGRVRGLLVVAVQPILRLVDSLLADVLRILCLVLELAPAQLGLALYFLHLAFDPILVHEISFRFAPQRAPARAPKPAFPARVRKRSSVNKEVERVELWEWIVLAVAVGQHCSCSRRSCRSGAGVAGSSSASARVPAGLEHREERCRAKAERGRGDELDIRSLSRRRASAATSGTRQRPVRQRPARRGAQQAGRVPHPRRARVPVDATRRTRPRTSRDPTSCEHRHGHAMLESVDGAEGRGTCAGRCSTSGRSSKR